MNVQDYKNAGYEMSQYIDQSKVNLAEVDAARNYLEPLGVAVNYTMPGQLIDLQDAPVKDALMCLAFLIVLQRTTFATRAGSKEKTTAQSMQADRWTILEQWAAPAQEKLQVLAARTGLKPWRACKDIAGVYFKTHFIG